MIDNQESQRTRKLPFVIAYNYRTSPINPTASPKKHRIKRAVITTPRTAPKRCRKMTENIATNRINEEQEHQLSMRSVQSQADMISPETPLQLIFTQEYEQIHEQSDLEKGIPIEVREVDLDEGSAIENSTFKNNYLFDQLICDRNMDETPKTN